MDDTDVERRLRERFGYDPASAGPGLVARAVGVRMSALGVVEGDLYLALLDRSVHELDPLVEEVVVSESWFFRDELPFALLAERRKESPFTRVLSVPCAGGQEPYSVAIALLDRGIALSRFHVVAVDLSRKALAEARKGVYSGNAFRSRDLAFRDRHFRRTADGYAVDDAVKESVEFRQGNLMAPDFLAGEPPFDAVFCRNLLIYLDEPARRRARSPGSTGCSPRTASSSSATQRTSARSRPGSGRRARRTASRSNASRASRRARRRGPSLRSSGPARS